MTTAELHNAHKNQNLANCGLVRGPAPDRCGGLPHFRRVARPGVGNTPELSAPSRTLPRVDHDDSTFGGLSPLTAILIVLALAALGGVLSIGRAACRGRGEISV